VIRTLKESGRTVGPYKVAVIPKAIYRHKVIPIKIPMAFFCAEMKKMILKFMYHCKGL
jgi:hypothetical protein